MSLKPSGNSHFGDLVSRYIRLVSYSLAIGTVVIWAWLRSSVLGRVQPQWLPVPLDVITLIVDATAATIVAATVIRVLVAKLARRELVQILADAVLFNRDFLAALEAGTKRQAIQSLLEDFAGPTLAAAVQRSLVDPYLAPVRIQLRESRRYDARLEYLSSAITLAHSIQLPPAEYYILETRDIFSINLNSAVRKSGNAEIILALSEAQLRKAYEIRECVFRELLVLTATDRTALLTHMARSGFDASWIDQLGGEERMQSQIAVRCQCAGAELRLAEATYDNDTGIRLRYRIPSATRRVDSAIEWDVLIRVPFSRIRPRHPVVYGEPTRVWLVTFDVSGIAVDDLTWDVLLTTAEPEKIAISDTDAQRVSINLGGRWVFPMSGIVFAWRDPAS